MPGYLTHWRVLIETARCTQDAGSDLGSLIIDASALRRRALGWAAPPPTTPAGAVWHTGPLPAIDFRFPGSDISSMAYLGAIAPDIPLYQKRRFAERMRDDSVQSNTSTGEDTSDAPDWGMMIHSRRSGDVLLALIEHIANVPAPALRSQALAFAMGYMTHLAADMALRPYINALASSYNKRDLPGILRPFGRRFYVELCIDHLIAPTFFKHPRFHWPRQPWQAYIEPASTHLLQDTSLTAKVPTLLTDALASVYGLHEEQGYSFTRDLLDGVRNLQRALAGNDPAQQLLALRWQATENRRGNDPICITLAKETHTSGEITCEQVMGYAVRLSSHLCRLAIGYYSALRNAEVTASERSERRAALRADICNWDTTTGYRLDVTFDEQVTVHLLHNWVYFARLWELDE